MSPTLSELRDLARRMSDGSYAKAHPERRAQLATHTAHAQLEKDSDGKERVTVNPMSYEQRRAVQDDLFSDGEITLLHYALLDRLAWRKFIRIPGVLQGADFNAIESKYGCYVVHFAVLARNLDALWYLLTRMDSRAQTMAINLDGEPVEASAFDLAAALGYTDCARVCIGRGKELSWGAVFNWTLEAPGVEVFHVLVSAEVAQANLQTDFLCRALSKGRVDILDDI